MDHLMVVQMKVNQMAQWLDEDRIVKSQFNIFILFRNTSFIYIVYNLH